MRIHPARVILIASVLSFRYADELTLLPDTLAVPGIWTMTEMNMSIICACLPTWPNLLKYLYDGSRPNGPKSESSASIVGLMAWIRSKSSSGREASLSDAEEAKSHQLSSASMMFSKGAHESRAAGHPTPKANATVSHDDVRVRRDVDVYYSRR